MIPEEDLQAIAEAVSRRLWSDVGVIAITVSAVAAVLFAIWALSGGGR